MTPDEVSQAMLSSKMVCVQVGTQQKYAWVRTVLKDSVVLWTISGQRIETTFEQVFPVKDSRIGGFEE